VTLQFVFRILTNVLSSKRLSLVVSLAFGPVLRFAVPFEVFVDFSVVKPLCHMRWADDFEIPHFAATCLKEYFPFPLRKRAYALLKSLICLTMFVNLCNYHE
jgi:hypothetical protein